jgi:hypothetical protein
MDDKRNGDQMKRGATEAVDAASNLAGTAQTAAAEGAGTIGDSASDTIEQVSDAAAKAYVQATDYVNRNTAEQPLLALLLAGAVGYAIAYLIHTRKG